MSPARVRKSRRGLGLVELLVSLAIAASLLTATAMALDSAVQAYQINLQQATLLQTARLAMNRILSATRSSAVHAPSDTTLRTQFAAGATVNGTGISLFDDAGVETAFKYDAANKRIALTAGTASYTLLDGVEEFLVTLEPMRSQESVRTGGNFDLLKRATVQVTLRTNDRTFLAIEAKGKVSITLSASVMPRRNTW